MLPNAFLLFDLLKELDMAKILRHLVKRPVLTLSSLRKTLNSNMTYSEMNMIFAICA